MPISTTPAANRPTTEPSVVGGAIGAAGSEPTVPAMIKTVRQKWTLI